MTDYKSQVTISKNDKQVLTIDNTYDGSHTHFLELLKDLKSEINTKLTDLVVAEKEILPASTEIERKYEDGKI